MMQIKKFRKVDLIALGILLVMWTVSVYLIEFAKLDFMFYVFVLGFLITGTALVVRKTGSVVLFCFIAGLIAYPIPVLTNNPLIELLLIVVAGIVLEATLLLTKKRALNVMLAAMISLAILPWILWLMLPVYSESLFNATMNFSLINLIMGGIGSLAAMLIYLKIRTTKLMVKFKLESRY